MRSHQILLSLLVFNTFSTLSAAPIASFDDIQRVTSDGSLNHSSLNQSSLRSSLYSSEFDEDAQATILRTHSSLLNMSKEEREKLAKKLGESKREELEKAIPQEKQEAAEQKKSCCFVFWKSVFKISSKTLGGLAIDIILDLSDGKLDGQGPNGSIDYVQHIANIINVTMEEASTI